MDFKMVNKRLNGTLTDIIEEAKKNIRKGEMTFNEIYRHAKSRITTKVGWFLDWDKSPNDMRSEDAYEVALKELVKEMDSVAKECNMDIDFV